MYEKKEGRKIFRCRYPRKVKQNFIYTIFIPNVFLEVFFSQVVSKVRQLSQNSLLYHTH